MKVASTFTFGDNMWIGAHILNQIICKKVEETCMFLSVYFKNCHLLDGYWLKF